MKCLKIAFVIIFLIGLAACEPPVTFTEPQPADTDNLSKFPKRLKGEYLSLSDSSILSIDDKLIYREYDFYHKIHLYQLDSTVQLSGDTLINIETKERQRIKRKGDSLTFHIYSVDTLFQMNNNVVRKFKGYYFLNTRYDEASWLVKKIQLSKGQLIISSISTKEEIQSLQNITGVAQDTVVPYRFTATKREFKKFVKNDGFRDSETLVKLKK